MKKFILFLVVILGLVVSSFIIGNNNEEKEKIVKKTIVKEKVKENYEFVTTENDNIGEVLKNKEQVNVTKKVVNKVKEEKNEELKDVDKKNGFIIEENNTYYYENGNIVIGTKIIDGKEYFFDEKGIMKTNSLINKKYYGEEGYSVFGFFEIEGSTYYFNESGYVTGVNEIDSNIYLFNEEGVMQKDVVVENCYYDKEGKLYTGFKDIDSYTYYFTIDGFVKGIYEIENNKYYFDEEGHLLRNTFIDKYYVDENGIIVTGTKIINGITYIFDNNGVVQNGFQIIDGKQYFLDESLNPLTGIHFIEGTRYYFDFTTGELMRKNVKSVIDISSWQGDIDFERLKESNLVDAVIVRLGYGTTLNDSPILDNKFKRNISELNRLEIPYGIYFFGYAQNEYASTLEANFVNNALKEVNAKLSFPIFYDAELSEFDGVKYTKTMYRKVVNNFVSKLNELGYKEVGLYGNLYMLTSGSLSFSKKYPIWVAQYYTKCQYDKDYVGWQYTSDGSIPGIEGRVDLNIFY